MFSGYLSHQQYFAVSGSTFDMNRRQLLGSVGVGLSTSIGGCLNVDLPGGKSEDNSITIVESRPDASPKLPVEPSVSIENGTATPGSPASLRIVWENQSETVVRLGESRQAVFFAAYSDTKAARLLAPYLGKDSVAFKSGCWRVIDQILIAGSYNIVDLDPGETHSGTVQFYSNQDTCLTSDTYHFQDRVNVGNPSTADSRAKTAHWGFTLKIETE